MATLPDPRTITSLAGYSVVLGELRETAGLSARAIVRRSEDYATQDGYAYAMVSLGSIHRWTDGDAANMPYATSPEALRSYLRACGVGVDDLPAWIEVLGDLRRRSVDPEAPTATDPGRPPGWWASAGPTDPARATDLGRLAEELERQWRAEAGVRRLNDPHPIRVSWRAAPEHLVADWASLTEAARSGVGSRSVHESGWGYGPEALAGAGPDLVDVVARRVPTGRLVVLGRPGAGKTMLLVALVLGLLDERAATGGRVPVLLSLASWDPATTTFHDWLCDAVTTDHPWLRQRDAVSAIRRRKVETLVDTHRLYPVLDGLDEMDPRVRGRAASRINDWLAASMHHRLTLTCRLADFEAMTAASADPAPRLAGTAGVLIDDLDPYDVKDYLRRDTGHANSTEHWGPVLDEIGTESPVGQTFRTPLMVGLARVVYGATADPRELTCRNAFPDPGSIEQHLFDGFVPAAYRDSPDAELSCPWPAKKSETWLRNLARHLDDPSGSTARGDALHTPLDRVDLRWWELHTSVPPWRLGVVVAALPALAVGAATVVAPALGARHPLGVGLGLGLVIGVLAVLALGRLGLPHLERGRTVIGVAFATGASLAGAAVGGMISDPGGRGATAGLIGAVGVGLGVGPLGGVRSTALAGLAGGLAVGLTASAGAGPVAAVVEGLGAGLAVGAIVVLAGRSHPARGVRMSRWSLGPGLAAAGLGGVAGYFTTGHDAVTTALAAVAGLCLGMLNPDADLREATGPIVSLRRDRGTFIVFASISGATICAGASLAVHPAVGLAGGLTVGTGFASLQAAWLRYAVARVVLAARGELPWRLMAFLEDAHRQRGVLRQIGAVYQFRHVELQRRLAGRR